MNKKIVFVFLTLGGCLTTMASSFVNIDTKSVSDSSKVVDLDEIVVVAQPKEQVRLRLQPVSSNVLGSKQLQQLHVTDLSEVSQYVPSFVMPAYGSRLTSSMYMRGIGSRINNPAVGVYYDNIPLMSKAAFNHHFYMLDRVDILRGPQGTLYGQNTEGGLVRIYTKRPTNYHYQGTDVHLGLATGLQSKVEVAHHQQPSEHLAFTVAGFYQGLKGFINNQNFDEKNDLTNEAGGRVRLEWRPTEQLTFDWLADYQYVNQNGFGYGEMSSDYKDVDDPATTIMNGYKRNLFTTGLNIGYETDNLMLTSTTSYQFMKDQMQMDQDYMTPDYLQLNQRQKMNAITQELVLRSKNKGLIRQIFPQRWQHATGLFAAYQWLNTNAPVYFGDAITGPIGNAITKSMQSAMQGSMYPRMYQQMLNSMLAQGMPQSVAEQQAAAAAQQAVNAAIAGVTMEAEMAVPETFKTPTLNLAAYHESNFLLGYDWKLTLGLRFNVDEVKVAYDALAYMNMTGGTAERKATYHLTSHVVDSRKKTYTQLLPKIGLTYSLDGNLGNIYAVVAKGYRAGGYNIQMFSDVLQTELNANQQNAMRGDYDVPHSDADYDAIEETIAYKPEESWNYEVGTHLNLFGGSTHFDLAIYYMQIRNQQLSIMAPESNYGRIMVNAGKSHSCGLEATLRGRALDNAMDWGLSYAFTNAKFEEYDTYEDNYVPFVPQHTMSAMVDYRLGALTIGANLHGQGKIWWDEANTYSQKFYAVLGAHADYQFKYWQLSLWARNLTNTHYNTFAVASSAAGGKRYFAQRATPIQVGVDMSFHF